MKQSLQSSKAKAQIARMHEDFSPGLEILQVLVELTDFTTESQEM